MSNTIYLYLKTHNKTGLKYLGKTIRDPYEYPGSGKHWKRHLAKHGYDVTTEILFETTNPTEIKRVGLEYSEKWNIVESKEFANLMPEQGNGGSLKGRYQPPQTEEAKAMISEKLSGRKLSKETRQKISDVQKGKEISEETKRKRVLAHSKRQPVKCPHCGKESKNISSMNRWHFDNCSLLGIIHDAPGAAAARHNKTKEIRKQISTLALENNVKLPQYWHLKSLSELQKYLLVLRKG